MIVVDTNVVAYTLIEGAQTALARQARLLDTEWRLPTLWRHEFLNILATYARRGGASVSAVTSLWEQAVELFSPGERRVDMPLALRLAVHHRVSAYDAQFVALAQTLDAPCLTEDQRLLKAFPDRALSLEAFCRR